MSGPSREEIFFNAALKLAESERAAYLQEICGAETELRARVEALLQAQGQPILSDQTKVVAFTVPLTEKPGDKIGRYKLLEQIGEGGFGVVYVAEQEQPVRRRVALKVIKMGMDTKQVIARFEAERQALALMDHPNIAKVLDAGATDSGRPYFVMELVKGERITEYCDKNNVPTRQRLDLFVQICHAIQHAHQKGIIHRDIKPSNILVTMHDGIPVPKVIDFGIAKATEQRLTDKTVYTALEQMIGTPAYMSPEQAEMTGLDIDTRSDIYSLGVLLYELLTGKTPFDGHELAAAGLEAMRRTIREKEPQRPSTRLTTMVKEELTAAAKQRQTDPLKLIHLVRGDLDWIVMKCLEKDRTRRYETANGLAFDILRHVNNEPVLARPPSHVYQFQKLVRRNKLVCAAAAGVALALLLGAGVSLWQAVRATRQGVLAKQRLAESEAVSKFLTELFQTPDPARAGHPVSVSETLAAAARKLETDSSIPPPRRVTLQAALASTCDALGLYPEAAALQEKVRDYYLAVSGLENADTLAAMHNLATSYDEAGRRNEALKLRERVLAIRRKTIGPEKPETLEAMHNLAISYVEADRLDEALELRKEVLALSRKVNGPEHPDTIRAMHRLAFSLHVGDEAVRLREETLALSRKVNGPEHPDTILAMDGLAHLYGYVGRLDEALKLGEESLALHRKVSGLEHPDTVESMVELSDSYERASRPAEAIKLREQVLAIRRKVLGPQHPDTLSVMHKLADSYCCAGRDEEATAILATVCELEPENPTTLLTLATWQTWFGQNVDYDALRHRLVRQAEGSDRVPRLEQAAKAYCLRPSTNTTFLTNALDLAAQAVDLGKGSKALPWCQLTLGLAQYRNSQFAAAEQTFAAAEQASGGFHVIVTTARLFHAMSLFRQDRAEEARKLFSQAEADVPPLPADERKPLIDGKLVNHDVIICWLAYKEANSLLNDPTSARH